MSNNLMYYSEEGQGIVEPQIMYCRTAKEESKIEIIDEQDGGAKIIRSQGMDFVRQPCKARGVNVKPGQNPHVARYAYIDIPLKTMHGTVLSCCHPICISSGRRFRYCAHCQTAVAKRNFNVRHAHGSMNSPPPKPGQLVKTATTTTPEVEVLYESDGDKTSNKRVPTSISVDDQRSVKTCNEETSTVTVEITPQEADFVNLLRSRPGDDYPDKVRQWKMTLLSLTDRKLYRYPVYHRLEQFHEHDAYSIGNVECLEDLDYPSLEALFAS